MIGRAYQNAGKIDEPSASSTALPRSTPRAREAHYFLGLLYLSQNEWVATPQAREQFTEEVKINPKDFFGNFFLGYVDNADKLYDDSDRYLRPRHATSPTGPNPICTWG